MTKPVILVQVWGLDANGKVFSQSVRAHPGVNQDFVLEGIQVALRVGEFLRVQCEDRKANFFVVEVNENAGRVKIRPSLAGRPFWPVGVPSRTTRVAPVPERALDQGTPSGSSTAPIGYKFGGSHAA